MDFSDQEHYAVQMLCRQDGTPTELGEQVSRRYREIMVDEYQDTNEVQNCIFRAVSRQGENIFAVGDVKQSIYRFRLAEPGIFLEKYRTYADADHAEPGAPRRRVLSRNFRSRREVLAAANFVFAALMSREMGELDYTEEQHLHFGAEYYPEVPRETEFHYLAVEDTPEQRFDRAEAEARFVAKRIRRMLDEGFTVRGEDGTMRPAAPEDIVILMRSPSARQTVFAAALAREGIPCDGGESEDFFSAMEVTVVLSLLEVVDNPRQDVPLIAVLRSPLVGMSADRLAEIRAVQREGDYYEALRQSSAGWDTNENSYFPFIENFLSTLYMCYKALDKRFAGVHGKRITKKARVEATVLNSLTPLSKADICKILPDVSPTTVEAVLGAMIRTGSVKRIGAGRATRYIKA